jgi:ankyrin repeat protein
MAVDKNGWTQLYWAVKQSQEVLVKMLDAGSDVISKDNDGCIALNWQSCEAI